MFGTGQALRERQVQSPKTKRTSVGGWPQARYQRHVENFHLHSSASVEDILHGVRDGRALIGGAAVAEMDPEGPAAPAEMGK